MDYMNTCGKRTILWWCFWVALVTRVHVMGTSAGEGQCFDWKGDMVQNGEEFKPNNEDLCMTCTCHNGFTITCHAVTCHRPEGNCVKWEKIETECCEYKCLETHGMNPDAPGMENSTIGNGGTVDDDSITNLGLRLVASTVTSFLVLALLLFMVHRLRQRRLLLAMRRFEAQARRQQLEESDSDPYIPDPYLGMIECPPYEDPPPYSSPKPHPRILPGEAPPPYEEIDQNRNSTINNNSINQLAAEIPRRDASQSFVNQNCQTDQTQSRSRPRRSLLGQCEQREVLSLTSSSPQRSNSDVQDIPGVCSESSHNSSVGSVESHNCSCDSEQTLLKKTVGAENVSSTASQTLPAGFSLGQDRSRHKGKQHSASPRTSKSYQGQMNPGAEISGSSANSSQSLPHEANPGNEDLPVTSQRYSSLPLRTEPVIAREQPERSREPILKSLNSSAGLPHPLAGQCSGRPSVPPRQRAPAGMSQSCVLLRDHQSNVQGQEFLRKSLPPLDLNESSAGNSQKKPDEVVNDPLVYSDEQLRTVRLSNLLNDPVASFENCVSPESPVCRQLRSQSVTSQLSVFSVCSETGEKKATREAGNVIGNDSQYPDIPISAHAMRMAALIRQAESQGQTNDLDGSGHDKGYSQGQSSANSLFKGVTGLNSAVTEADSLQSDWRPEGNAAQGATNSPSKSHRAKRKDKHKSNRHSTGNIQPKPKKHTQNSSSQLPPSAMKAEGSPTASPVHGKKGQEPSRASPKLPCSPGKSSRTDSPKKKSGKPVCDSYKQYGFIDEPGSIQPMNGIIELKVVNSDNLESSSPQLLRKSGLVMDKGVSGCEVKQSAITKINGKRSLPVGEKSSHSPSPVRQKSRPRSFVQPPGYCEGLPVQDRSHPVTSSPRRKARGVTKSKKRVSYPISGPSAAGNGLDHLGDQGGQPVNDVLVLPDLANQEPGQGSHPVGLITFRNGPLSSYV